MSTRIPSSKEPFIKLVTEILKRKKANPSVDTSELERKIDLLVYELYGLTEAEIKIIEQYSSIIILFKTARGKNYTHNRDIF